MKANGFTLVELLAAMMAGSLLLVALGSVTASLGRDLRRSAVENDAMRIAQAAPLLQRLAAALQPDEAGEAGIALTPVSLAGDIAPPDALGPVGALHLALDVEKQRDGEALVARVTPADEAIALPPAATRPTTIVGGFRSIRFCQRDANVDDPADRPIIVRFLGQRGGERTLALVSMVTNSNVSYPNSVAPPCR